MPKLAASKYDVFFKVAVTIIVVLIGALGASLGMFAGYLIATFFFASPDASIDGQTIGGVIGLALAVWFVAVSAKELRRARRGSGRTVISPTYSDPLRYACISTRFCGNDFSSTTSHRSLLQTCLNALRS